MNFETANNYINFKSKILAEGIIKYKLKDVTANDMKILFPIFYQEMLNGDLKISENNQVYENTTLSGWGSFTKKIKKIVKPVTSKIEQVIKNPSTIIKDVVIKPVNSLSPSVGKQLSNVIGKTKILKVIDAPSQFIVKNPEIAMAVGTVASFIIPPLAPAVAIGTDRYINLQENKAIDEQKRLQKIYDAEFNSLLVEAETTGNVQTPDKQQIEILPLETLESVGYFDDQKKSALTNLVKMGYDANNPATLLMAESIVNGKIEKQKQELAKKNKFNMSLMLPALAAGALLIAG